MRINAIQSYNYKPAFAENNKPSEKKEYKITAKQIGYGLAGLAAIGLATYAIIRKGKKPSGAVIEDTAESVKGKLKPRPNSAPDLKPGAAEEPEKIIKPKKTEDAAAPTNTEGSVPDAKPAQEEQVASANGSQEKPKTEPAAESSKNKETTEQSAAKNSNTEEQQNNNSVNSENDKELHSKIQIRRNNKPVKLKRLKLLKIQTLQMLQQIPAKLRIVKIILHRKNHRLSAV